MAKSSAGEVEFLRDQVQRLEATLAQYQHGYKKSKPADSGTVSDAPWAKPEVLSPLLLEYDDSINECMEAYQKLKSEFDTMKKELDHVVKENEKLRLEMKDALSSAVSESEKHGVHEETNADLRQQLELAVDEKERLAEVCQAAVADVERMELEMEQLKTRPQWRQTAEVKDQYQHAVGEMTREIQNLQNELKRSKSEQRTAEVQVSDLRQTLEELRQQLDQQHKAHVDAVGEGVLFQEENELAKMRVTDSESKLLNLKIDFEKISAENKNLKEVCEELQSKCVDLEQKEYEASLQVRDSVQLVDNAVLERDEVRIREQQLIQENRKLQDAINKLLDEAGSRTREEVENVKQMCNANLERLTEELYQLEMESAEKSTQMERISRDKKQLENELEQCYKEGLKRGTKDDQNISELTKRACEAEAERDDALIKFRNLSTQMQRFEITRTQERQQLITECKQLKERVKTLNQELDSLNKERLQIQDELISTRKQVASLQKEKDVAERKFSKDISSMEQEYRMKEQEYLVRMQTLEDSHRQSLLDARRQLNVHQKSSAKWKVECESLAHQFEKKVAQLRAEGTKMKQKNMELINLLAENEKRTTDARRMVSDYTRNVKRMEDRLRDAEERARYEMPRVNGSYRAENSYSPVHSDRIGSPLPGYTADDYMNGAI